MTPSLFCASSPSLVVLTLALLPACSSFGCAAFTLRPVAMSASFQSQSVRPFEMGDDHTLVVGTSGMDERSWLELVGRPHSGDLRVDEVRKLLNDQDLL